MNQQKNILKVYEEIETNQIFGAPEIERVLKCSTSTVKNVMKKLREMGVVEESKGKYTFISDSNYVKKVNEVGAND
jgi:Fic family protein